MMREETEPRPSDRGADDGGSRSILLVGADDVRDAVGAAHPNHTIATVSDLASGMAAFDREQPSALVCGLDGDGWQLTPLIRKAGHKGVPVIAIAATAEAVTSSRAARWAIDRGRPDAVAAVVAQLLANPDFVPEDGPEYPAPPSLAPEITIERPSTEDGPSEPRIAAAPQPKPSSIPASWLPQTATPAAPAAPPIDCAYDNVITGLREKIDALSTARESTHAWVCDRLDAITRAASETSARVEKLSVQASSMPSAVDVFEVVEQHAELATELDRIGQRQQEHGQQLADVLRILRDAELWREEHVELQRATIGRIEARCERLEEELAILRSVVDSTTGGDDFERRTARLFEIVEGLEARLADAERAHRASEDERREESERISVRLAQHDASDAPSGRAPSESGDRLSAEVNQLQHTQTLLLRRLGHLEESLVRATAASSDTAPEAANDERSERMRAVAADEAPRAEMGDETAAVQRREAAEAADDDDELDTLTRLRASLGSLQASWGTSGSGID